MEYNAEKRAFLCTACGPGHNKWKLVYTSVLVDEETGDCYCIVHNHTKIGHVDMVPEWRKIEDT